MRILSLIALLSAPSALAMDQAPQEGYLNSHAGAARCAAKFGGGESDFVRREAEAAHEYNERIKNCRGSRTRCEEEAKSVYQAVTSTNRKGRANFQACAYPFASDRLKVSGSVFDFCYEMSVAKRLDYQEIGSQLASCLSGFHEQPVAGEAASFCRELPMRPGSQPQIEQKLACFRAATLPLQLDKLKECKGRDPSALTECLESARIKTQEPEAGLREELSQCRADLSALTRVLERLPQLRGDFSQKAEVRKLSEAIEKDSAGSREVR